MPPTASTDPHPPTPERFDCWFWAFPKSATGQSASTMLAVSDGGRQCTTGAHRARSIADRPPSEPPSFLQVGHRVPRFESSFSSDPSKCTQYFCVHARAAPLSAGGARASRFSYHPIPTLIVIGVSEVAHYVTHHLSRALAHAHSGTY